MQSEERKQGLDASNIKRKRHLIVEQLHKVKRLHGAVALGHHTSPC